MIVLGYPSQLATSCDTAIALARTGELGGLGRITPKEEFSMRPQGVTCVEYEAMSGKGGTEMGTAKSEIKIGTEVLLEQLLDELRYQVIIGGVVLKCERREMFGDRLITDREHLEGKLNGTHFFRAYFYIHVPGMICIDLYEPDFGGMNLIEAELMPDHRLYRKIEWLFSFARGEVMPAAVTEIRNILKRERKVTRLIDSLANSEPINSVPDASKLPTSEEERLRTILRGVANTVGEWGRKIRANTKGGAAKKEFVARLIEAMDSKQQEILDALGPNPETTRGEWQPPLSDFDPL